MRLGHQTSIHDVAPFASMDIRSSHRASPAYRHPSGRPAARPTIQVAQSAPGAGQSPDCTPPRQWTIPARRRSPVRPAEFQRPPKRAAPSPERGRCAQRGTKARHKVSRDGSSGIDAGADCLQIGKHLVGLALANEIVGRLSRPAWDRLMLEPDRRRCSSPAISPAMRQNANDRTERRVDLARAGLGGERVACDTDQARQFGQVDAEQFRNPPCRKKWRLFLAEARRRELQRLRNS